MRYGDILGYLPIVEEYGETELPLKLTMRLSIRVGKLRNAAEQLDTQRRATLRKICKKDDEGNPVMLPDGRFDVDQSEFREAWEEVLLDEAGVSLPTPLKLEDFNAVEKMPFRVMAAMQALGIVEESDG